MSIIYNNNLLNIKNSLKNKKKNINIKNIKKLNNFIFFLKKNNIIKNFWKNKKTIKLIIKKNILNKNLNIKLIKTNEKNNLIKSNSLFFKTNINKTTIRIDF